jgi:hypothetical protein
MVVEVVMRYVSFPSSAPVAAGTLVEALRAPRHRDHLFHAIVITHSTAS